MKSKIHQYLTKNKHDMSKKFIILSALTLVLLSCGNKENGQSIDKLIETKNVKALQEKKTALQT